MVCDVSGISVSGLTGLQGCAAGSAVPPGTVPS